MRDHGPLAGVRIVEIAGIGPAPFCGMLLADLGADVVVVGRPAPDPDALDLGSASILDRGKRFIQLDLKQPDTIKKGLQSIQAGSYQHVPLDPFDILRITTSFFALGLNFSLSDYCSSSQKAGMEGLFWCSDTCKKGHLKKV